MSLGPDKVFCEKYVKRIRRWALVSATLFLTQIGSLILIAAYREMAIEAMNTTRQVQEDLMKMTKSSEEAWAEVARLSQALSDIRSANELYKDKRSPFKALVTAYTPYSESTGKGPGHPAFLITRSGWRAGFGVCAADTSYWPFGSVFYISGYGFCRVVDTGGAIKGKRRFDVFIWFPDDEKKSIELARKWGKREVDVYPVCIPDKKGGC